MEKCGNDGISYQMLIDIKLSMNYRTLCYAYENISEHGPMEAALSITMDRRNNAMQMVTQSLGQFNMLLLNSINMMYMVT